MYVCSVCIRCLLAHFSSEFSADFSTDLSTDFPADYPADLSAKSCDKFYKYILHFHEQ